MQRGLMTSVWSHHNHRHHQLVLNAMVTSINQKPSRSRRLKKRERHSADKLHTAKEVTNCLLERSVNPVCSSYTACFSLPALPRYTCGCYTAVATLCSALHYTALVILCGASYTELNCWRHLSRSESYHADFSLPPVADMALNQNRKYLSQNMFDKYLQQRMVQK